MRNTSQRLEILDFLRENKTHPTVDEVFETVKKKLPTISKATVYRNLKYLAGIGTLREVLIHGVIRYESNIEPHHHAICVGCGKIIDFVSDELTRFSLETASRLEDFELHTATTNFYGTCTRCKEIEFREEGE